MRDSLVAVLKPCVQIVIGSGGSPSLTLSSAVNTVSGDFVTSGTSTFNGAVTMTNTLQVNSPLLSPSNVFFLGDSSSTAAVRLQTVDLPGRSAPSFSVHGVVNVT